MTGGPETAGNAFYTRPEHERCQAMLNGCTGDRAVSISCKIEGRATEVCSSCAQVWRHNAQTGSLQDRCPRCALWRPGAAHTPDSPASPVPLAGEAALAIDAAMHAEGLLVDIRHRVLARLNRDAYWMTFAVHQDTWTGV